MPRSIRAPGAAPAAAVVVADDDVLLTRNDAARVVGLAPATLRDMACRREGPVFVKRGASRQGRCYYRRSDLLRWLASCTRVVGN